MNWPQAFLEAIEWICGTAIAIVLIAGLLDLEISFYPPKDGSKPRTPSEGQ